MNEQQENQAIEKKGSGKITGKFEYDVETREFYIAPYPNITVMLPLVLHPEKEENIITINDDSTIEVDECCLWFDYIGDGIMRVASISCDNPKRLEL